MKWILLCERNIQSQHFECSSEKGPQRVPQQQIGRETPGLGIRESCKLFV